MPFSSQTINELRGEAEALRKDLTDLQSQAEKIRSRLAAIEEVLSDDVADTVSAKHFQWTFLNTDEPRLADLPFRQAIRRILRDTDRPLKVAEIRAILERNKVTPDGKTGLSARVSNELYKMKTANYVQHNNGAFSIPRELTTTSSQTTNNAEHAQ
ncbi:MAG: hypothetical protein H0V34_03330 [Gammaproteobacteria bacterium]|nr:hypothetical protein [Gammaproteobacteria bacterium]